MRSTQQSTKQSVRSEISLSLNSTFNSQSPSYLFKNRENDFFNQVRNPATDPELKQALQVFMGEGKLNVTLLNLIKKVFSKIDSKGSGFVEEKLFRE